MTLASYKTLIVLYPFSIVNEPIVPKCLYIIYVYNVYVSTYPYTSFISNIFWYGKYLSK